jgi:hypothetical protein
MCKPVVPGRSGSLVAPVATTEQNISQLDHFATDFRPDGASPKRWYPTPTARMSSCRSRGRRSSRLRSCERTRAPLDVFLVRKPGAPRHPEFAIGAIAAGGCESVFRLLDAIGHAIWCDLCNSSIREG